LEESGQVAIADKELTREGGPVEDRHLAMAFKAGDASSYGVIHQRYRAEVETLCRRMLGNYHDAEEATQETFIRVFQALPRFNGQYRLRPWIAKIATNVCLDMLRARTRANRVEYRGNGNGHTNGSGDGLGHANGHGNGHGQYASTEEWAERHQASGNGNGNGDLLDPLEILERRSQATEVREALATLPDHYRMALLMREYEGFSHEEIGAVLGMSTSQVKALLHRAKKSFRRVWTLAATRSFGLALPLLGWLRRFGRKAVEVSQPVTTGAAAGSQTATSVVTSVAASPVTASVAERAMAVIAAVTVTGAIGVGAVTVAHHHHAAAPKKAVVATVTTAPPTVAPAGKAKATPAPPVPANSPDDKIGFLPAPPNIVLTPTVAPSATGTGSATGALPSPPPQPEPPDVDPSPPASTGGTPDPTTTPTPSASPTPAVVIPDPPAWSGGFDIAFEGGDLCVCDGLTMIPLSSSGTPGQDFRFSQQLKGSGDLAGVTWDVDITVIASIPGADKDGTLKLAFTLTDADGTSYQFDGQGSLAPVPGDHADGIWSYAVAGSWSSGPDLGESGNIDGVFSWWTDGHTDNRQDQPVASTLRLTQAS
jgi:RNA polymerase sigma-70 factor (ECF subfamily)